MKQKISGIYLIEDIATGNAYVGQSQHDIAKRWSNHMTHLKKGDHKYIQLQEAYNSDIKRIKFTILEECKNDLKEREDWWMKHIENNIDDWNLINKQKNGGASKSVADTTKMKEAQTGESNGHNTKLCIADVKEIKKMLADCLKPAIIAVKFGVSQGLIYNIKNGTRWASVSMEVM